MSKFLETERIVLRRFEKNDLNDLYEYASVPGVGEMAGWPALKNTREAKAFLKMFIANPRQNAILLKSINKVIGSFSIKEVKEEIKDDFAGQNVVEFGFTISKEFWGQGIMPEILNAVIEYVFTVEEVGVITMDHFVDNIQSEKVIKKCGGVLYKMDVYHSQGLGKTLETKRYRILKEEYKNRR